MRGSLRLFLPSLSMAVLLFGCRERSGSATAARAEAAILRRQVDGLRDLVGMAEKGTLTRPDEIVIGITEDIVGQLLDTSLPLEAVVSDRFRVRLDSAEVNFRSSQSVIVLRGRVSPVRSADTYADLQLAGGLENLEIDPSSNRLTGRVVLDHLEVQRAAAVGTESRLVKSLLDGLAETGFESLGAVIPRLEIPVRVEPSITVKGFGEGAFSVQPGRLPVRLSVARVIPFNGRLWILLETSAGPWQSLTAEEARGSP
jgi:hypothetical protein